MYQDQIYEAIVRLAVLYTNKTWIITRKVEERTETLERNILRKILEGIKGVEGIWRRRTNQEIMYMYKKPKLARKIRGQTGRWLGRIIRL